MKPIVFLVSILLFIPFSTQLETQFLPVDNPFWIESVYRVDSTPSPKSLLGQRLQRDIHRTNSLSAKAGRKDGSLNSTVYSGESQESGEFFTRIGFGSPPQLVQVIVDTGSDNIWIQCQPCNGCYKQTDPLFDPAASTTSANVTCGSSRCPATRACTTSTTTSPNKTCPYHVAYGDGSRSSGDYMTETLTFRGTRVDDILFGCGHDNVGLFAGAGGLLGLGWGRKSFMGQAGSMFDHIFSYCLVGIDRPGKSYIMFGPTALSRTAAYTPLIKNRHAGLRTYYYVELEGISVGGEAVRIPEGAFEQDENGEGGVIVDSGTFVTRLAQPAYEAVRDAFRAETTHLKRTSGESIFDTCYDLSGVGPTSRKLPTVVLHFKGADMKLAERNCIVQLDDHGKFCFAFAGMGGGLSIIGHFQQAGFRMSYDLKKRRLGLTPGSCGQ